MLLSPYTKFSISATKITIEELVEFLEEHIKLLHSKSGWDYKAECIKILDEIEEGLHKRNQLYYFPLYPQRCLHFAHKNTDFTGELYYIGRGDRTTSTGLKIGLGIEGDPENFRHRLCKAYVTLFFGILQKRK